MFLFRFQGIPDIAVEVGHRVLGLAVLTDLEKNGTKGNAIISTFQPMRADFFMSA